MYLRKMPGEIKNHDRLLPYRLTSDFTTCKNSVVMIKVVVSEIAVTTRHDTDIAGFASLLVTEHETAKPRDVRITTLKC